jgi:hypothetical protein
VLAGNCSAARKHTDFAKRIPKIKSVHKELWQLISYGSVVSHLPNPRQEMKATCAFVLIFLIIFTSGCVQSKPVSQATPDLSATSDTTQFPVTPTTVDPNLMTISAIIDQSYSREEIANLLFSKWMDHFLTDNIGLEMRLSEYSINSISIPVNQYCVTRLGALFMAEAEITAKPILPLRPRTNNNTSQWMVAGGGILAEDDSHLTRVFNAAIFHAENIYTLNVITQAPLCE